MEVWIIRDGEKAGPFQDFEIRRKISTEEITAETPAWHEGLETWMPISNLVIFKNEFEKKPEALPIEAEGPALGVLPPPLPEKPVYTRRFFARWFDLQVYASLWWLTLWLLGVNLGNVWGNSMATLLLFVPWFALEAFLIHRLGTTPGKWLLGIRIRNIDDTYLTISASIRRAIRVLLAGVGLGWWLPFTTFCQGISLFVAKRFGNALWDFAGGHRVLSDALKPWRVILLTVGYIAALQLQVMIVFPWIPQEQIDAFGKAFPEWKEQMDKNPPLHLPKSPR